MKSVQHYIDMYRTTAQYAVPEEQVLAVGVLTRAGSMKSMAVSQLSPLAGMIMRHRQKKRANGFPLTVLMAVTPTRLISFHYKPRGTSVKIVRKVAEWPWHAVRVQAAQNGSGRIMFQLVDGTSVELQNSRSLGQYAHLNDPFYAALGLGAPV
ncbi:MAG: hypothetical protein JWL72_4526 [Ilumatobacteraceae bacterium]|nr:hypothetical protein [Ilumatobacteraceae bacterium]